jgi:hypothetical protein
MFRAKAAYRRDEGQVGSLSGRNRDMKKEAEASWVFLKTPLVKAVLLKNHLIFNVTSMLPRVALEYGQT